VTWRDEAEGWPHTLQTDRSAAVDPDSVGVAFDGDAGPLGEIVLFRGGWADVNLVDATSDQVITGNPPIPTVVAFGEVLDDLVDRLLGPT
jgi:hypothetical protein